MQRSARLPLYAAISIAAALSASRASAAPACRAVEIHLTPGAPGLQIAVWIENAQGKFIDTTYLTRATGQFGLGNRPGEALLKTDFRWPYGRREMVLPVWAHRRNQRYPKIMMGGICGDSPSSRCPDGSMCMGDCEDSTIAYHPRVSSFEPYFCSPSGPGLDAMSCASKGTFSKGAFAPSPVYSLYPPRADLATPCMTSSDCVGFQQCQVGRCVDGNDSPDVLQFAGLDDLVAISQATPAAGAPLVPAITWFAPATLAEGDYVAWVEASQESDFNKSHNHPNKADTVSGWDFEGHPFLGQPSVVFKVPFRLDGNAMSAGTSDYAGYSAWDGQDGTLRMPDGSIAVNQPGSGTGRFLADGGGHRVMVVVGGCGHRDAGVMTDLAVPPLVDATMPSSGDGTSPSPGDGGTPGRADGGSPARFDGSTPDNADARAPENTDLSIPGLDDAAAHGDLSQEPPQGCAAPDPVTHLALQPEATSITIQWNAPAGGEPPALYEVRYRSGSSAITDGNFGLQLAPSDTPPPPGMPGARLSTVLRGLVPEKNYTIAVRSRSQCGATSHVVSASQLTSPQVFVTLHGCFVATAAYGAPDDRSVETLRRFRDRHLLDNAVGRLLVAAYYAASPSLAGAIALDQRGRSAARAALAPLVDLATRLP